MRLGGSIQRRRGGAGSASAPVRRKRRGEDPKTAPPDALRLALRTLALALLGLGVGYLTATRLLFPAPPPPENLVEVPELLGLGVEEARVELADAGLELGAVEALRHPELDSGRVVGQGPLGGQLAAPGSPVRVTVSLGAQRLAVPEVSRLLGERALGVLEASGFRVSADTVDSNLPAGTVVEVNPPPGTMLSIPSDVRVTLSRGPSLVPMPSLLGLTQEVAIDSLRALGFGAALDTVFRFGRDQGLVVEQSPPADSLLPRGSRVRLSVGRRGGG